MRSRKPLTKYDMPEPSVTDPHIASGLKEALLYVGATLLALLGYNARTVIKRVDGHDDDLKEKVDEKIFNETVKSIRHEIEKGVQATKDAHDKQYDQNQKHNNDMTQRIDRILESKNDSH